MRSCLLLGPALMLALCLEGPARAEEEHAAPAAMPDATDLLARVVGALPDIPLLIKGDLQARNRSGDLEAKLGVEMLLDWQDDPPTARYTLRDDFGRTTSHLAITWLPGKAPEYRYFEGQPLHAAPLPDLVAPIGATDISWMDLSLSFLWWPDGRCVGVENVRGRPCFVIDLPAPPASFPGCAGVRLWIEPRIRIMLKAEAYNGANELIRRMEVKSFKKINDRWVIKDIELTSLPARSKTFLRVRDVQDRTRKTFVAEDEGGPEPEPGADEGVVPLDPADRPPAAP